MKKLVGFIILIYSLSGFLTGCQKRQYLPIAIKNAFTRSTELPVPNVGTPTATKYEVEKMIPPVTPTFPMPQPTPTKSNLLHLPLLIKPGSTANSSWQFVPRSLRGSKQGGRFILELRYPEVSASAPAATSTDFSNAIQEWLNLESEKFLDMVENTSAETANGFLVSNYTFASSPDFAPSYAEVILPANPAIYSAQQVILDMGQPVVSLLLQTSEYAGGAHPLEQHAAINFDIASGKTLQLADLFKSGVDYLTTIAQYCTTELYRRPDLQAVQIRRGAAPLIENYQIWNLTPRGLLITFEEYQVGPYSAGPQRVLIPYNVLTNLFSEQGPLKNMAISDIQ